MCRSLLKRTNMKMSISHGCSVYCRLTADDIRKQHPRVLANELDTLQLENGRLKSLVTSLEKDLKKLAFTEVCNHSFLSVCVRQCV